MRVRSIVTLAAARAGILRPFRAWKHVADCQHVLPAGQTCFSFACSRFGFTDQFYRVVSTTTRAARHRVLGAELVRDRVGSTPNTRRTARRTHVPLHSIPAAWSGTRASSPRAPRFHPREDNDADHAIRTRHAHSRIHHDLLRRRMRSARADDGPRERSEDVERSASGGRSADPGRAKRCDRNTDGPERRRGDRCARAERADAKYARARPRHTNACTFDAARRRRQHSAAGTCRDRPARACRTASSHAAGARRDRGRTASWNEPRRNGG
jgi:hypothetical protein